MPPKHKEISSPKETSSNSLLCTTSISVMSNQNNPISFLQGNRELGKTFQHYQLIA